MTITYQKNVSNTSFMGFAKLLFKWRGSIYKLIFKEMILYGGAYAFVSLCYRYYMNEGQKRRFEKIALYCDQTAGLLPMSFVLGFYVSFVVTRWWNQFLNLPWPDRVIHTLIMYISGTDDRARMLRRTLARYINLATIILFQTISGSVKKRFPTTTHLVNAGLMTTEEKQMFENVHLSVNKHWIPFIWFINLVDAAVKEGRIQQGEPVKQILEEMNNMRTKTGHLWGHDWVTVPLVYTQVVTLLTHLYFMSCLVGRQFLDPNQGYKGHDVDFYFPVYTFIQFFFFLGWLKVAEQLINPFGEDDDDFETNWFIDRNISVSYTIVDVMYGKVAKLEKDPHWGKGGSVDLPYTEATLVHKIPDYKGSTMNMVVPMREQTIVFHNVDEHPMDTEEGRVERTPACLEKIVSRFCCCCMPPLNKPLGESYGRTEPYSFDQYDATSKRRESNYSIFGDSYFTLINRNHLSLIQGLSGGLQWCYLGQLIESYEVVYMSGKRDSISSAINGHQNVSETTALTVPNNAYIRRHRPSLAANHVLTSVSEMEQEESESELAGTKDVKLALAFLDDDLEEVVEKQ